MERGYFTDQEQIDSIQFIVASKDCKNADRYCIELSKKGQSSIIELMNNLTKQEMKRQMVRIYAILHRHGVFVSNRDNMIVNVENAVDITIKEKIGIVKKYYIDVILVNGERFWSVPTSYDECKRLESYYEAAKYYKKPKSIIEQISK